MKGFNSTGLELGHSKIINLVLVMLSESLLAFSQMAILVNSAFMLELNSIGLDSEPKVDKCD
jgi:hypothetical protein